MKRALLAAILVFGFTNSTVGADRNFDLAKAIPWVQSKGLKFCEKAPPSGSVEKICRPAKLRVSAGSSWKRYKFERSSQVKCGRGSNIVDYLLTPSGSDQKSGVFQPFKNKKFRVFPILITDKTKWSCSRIEVQLACVHDTEPYDADHLGVILGTLEDIKKPQIFDKVYIAADRTTDYSFSETGMFHLIQSGTPFINSAIETAENFRCKPDESNAECRTQLDAAVGWLFQQELRLHHKARLDKPQLSVAADHLKLKQSLASQPAFNAMESEIAQNMIASEASSISPFELADAVIALSGLSFGPSQYDIGRGDPSQTSLWRDIEKEGLSGQNAGVVKKWVADGCFETDGRKFTVADWHAVYAAWPMLNRALELGADKIAAAFVGDVKRWAEKAGNKYEDITTFDKRLTMHLLDYENQYGESSAKKKATEIRAMVADHVSKEDIICRIYKAQTATAYGAENTKDVQRRYRQVFGSKITACGG